VAQGYSASAAIQSKAIILQLIELAIVAACREAGMKLADIRVARAFLQRNMIQNIRLLL
jgi:hypothetical protein